MSFALRARNLSACAVVALAAAGLTACGGSGRNGGSITILGTDYPDALVPGLS